MFFLTHTHLDSLTHTLYLTLNYSLVLTSLYVNLLPVIVNRLSYSREHLVNLSLTLKMLQD